MMKLLFLFILLLGPNLLWAKTEPAIERGFKTACHADLYRTTGVLVFGEKSPWSLENNYCERMNIKSPEQAFDEGRDMPTAELSFVHNEIRWLSQPSNSFDLVTLNDLNRLAEEAWGKILECHGTADKARRAYYEASNRCGLDQVIRNFSDSVRLYLQSTQIFQMQDSITGAYHPLLTQALLENALVTALISGIDTYETSDKYYQGRIIDFLIQGGTYESMKDGSYKGNFGHSFVFDGMLDQPALKKAFLRQNRKINANLLLSRNLGLLKCGEMGLWPGVTRLISAAMYSGAASTDLKSHEFETRAHEACGKITFDNTYYSYNGSSRRNQIKIIQLFRKLSLRYDK